MFCCAILVNCVVADGSLIIVSAVLCKFQLTVQSSRLNRRHEPVKRAVFIAKKDTFYYIFIQKKWPTVVPPIYCSHIIFISFLYFSMTDYARSVLYVIVACYRNVVVSTFTILS